MTEEEARARLELMVAWDAVPVLTSEEVDDLMVIARRPDEYGLLPTDEGWTETWNLNRAASEGWRRKAGKVAGAYDFSGDSQSFSRSQMHEMCLEMAAQYRRGGATSVAIATLAGIPSDLVTNLNEGG